MSFMSLQMLKHGMKILPIDCALTVVSNLRPYHFLCTTVMVKVSIEIREIMVCYGLVTVYIMEHRIGKAGYFKASLPHCPRVQEQPSTHGLEGQRLKWCLTEPAVH